MRTLRSGNSRYLLWKAAHGKCCLCGVVLPDNWHADHVKPYCKTGRTNLFEMQALCPKCNQKKGAKMADGGWRSYFCLSPEFRDQKGQVEAFELAANVSFDPAKPIQWLFEFITGYGKTLTSYGVFGILRARGIVNRMLVLVPSDNQREQFADDAQKAFNFLGLNVSAWPLDKAGREKTMVQAGNIDVFVATYQQLDEDSFFRDLMDLGHSWMLVGDEVHHLGESGVWARKWMALPNVAVRLGLTATPVRRDLKALLGMPDKFTLRVTYNEAFNEHVVKRVVGRVMHYYLDVEVDGKPQRITTQQLKDEGVTDFSQYEAKRQLRYNSNYLNQMLIDPLNDLASREVKYPGSNRMVVFCMTCRHAHHVTTQINDLCGQLGLKIRAEWVGVGEGVDGAVKTSQENNKLIKGFRTGNFQILVQVAKAEEGFDVPEVSVIAFLHLIGSDGKLLQQIGRALRRNRAIKDFEEDTATIYCSADTPVAELIERMQCEIPPAKKSSEDESNRQLGLWSIPDLLLIDALYDRTEFVGPGGVDPLNSEQRAFCSRFGIPPNEYLQHVGTGSMVAITSNSTTPAPIMSPKARFEAVKDQVNKNTSLLVGNIIKLLAANNCPIEKSTAGCVKTQVNKQWTFTSHIGHDDMTPDDFTRKNSWLQSVNQQIKLTREVPSWVLSALRR